MSLFLLHSNPTASVHWLEHWIEMMLLGGGLFILLIVGAWVYFKEQERQAALEQPDPPLPLTQS